MDARIRRFDAYGGRSGLVGVMGLLRRGHPAQEVATERIGMFRGRMRVRHRREQEFPMTVTSSRRSPPVAAVVIIAVLLLFGAATFVVGLVVGGAAGVAGEPSATAAPSVSVPSEAATPEATPGPTPVLETVSCAAPSEAFAVLCQTYAQIKGEYVDEVTDEELVDGAVRGMIEYGLEDPYSGYLPPSQYGEALDDLSGEFSGIGAEVGMENLSDPEDLASCTVVTATCAMVIVSPLDRKSTVELQS